MVDYVKTNAILAISCHDVSCTYILTHINIPFSLLFYATYSPTRIWKANLDGSDVTAIVTIGSGHVLWMAINYDKKRLCWTDYGTCCTSLSQNIWARRSILAIMSVKCYAILTRSLLDRLRHLLCYIKLLFKQRFECALMSSCCRCRVDNRH